MLSQYTLFQFSGENGEDQDSADEFDLAALNYNKALVLYFVILLLYTQQFLCICYFIWLK